MYFFYIDASGSNDSSVTGTRPDGTTYGKDHIYAIVAVSLHEHRWNRFETSINSVKRELTEDVRRATGRLFTIAEVEPKSNLLRRPSLRARHPFFNFLTEPQVKSLTNIFYEQLSKHYMNVFAVVIDKRKLADYFDSEKMQRKAYELLLERIQNFMRECHPKHLAIIVADDEGTQMNRSLTLKHNYFQRCGTSAGVRLSNIVETPFFVRSELSNGTQLADFCAYNVYRTFLREDPEYHYFKKMLRGFYNSRLTAPNKLDGLKVFPDDSDLMALAEQIGKKNGPPS